MPNERALSASARGLVGPVDHRHCGRARAGEVDDPGGWCPYHAGSPARRGPTRGRERVPLRKSADPGNIPPTGVFYGYRAAEARNRVTPMAGL